MTYPEKKYRIVKPPRWEGASLEQLTSVKEKIFNDTPYTCMYLYLSISPCIYNNLFI